MISLLGSTLQRSKLIARATKHTLEDYANNTLRAPIRDLLCSWKAFASVFGAKKQRGEKSTVSLILDLLVERASYEFEVISYEL